MRSFRFILAFVVAAVSVVSGCRVPARADVASDIADLKAWRKHAEQIAPELSLAPHVYVSATGDDAADGLTDATPVKSWARACALATGDGLTLLFRRGDTFGVDRAMTIHGDGIRVGAYGDANAAKPVLSLSVARSDLTMIALAAATNATIEGLTFDSSVSRDTDKRNVAVCVEATGRAIAVRGCTFLNVMSAVVTQSGSRVDGMLVDGCDAPLPTGLRAYFVFAGGGSDWTVSNNRTVNSTREHSGVRGGTDGMTIVGNDFGQLDRTQAGDPGDFAKSVNNVQLGGRVVIRGNTFRGGSTSVGPLGGTDGIAHPEYRVTDVLVEDNRLIGSQLQVQHGTAGVVIRNNLIAIDNAPAIALYDFAPAPYNRGVASVVIDHNTAVNATAHGNFARVGNGATGVSITNNVYVAPAMETGGWDTGALSIGTPSSLATVAGNRWPAPLKPGNHTQGGNVILAGQYAPPAAWALIAPTDRTLAIAAGTFAVDGAGVDVAKLPAVTP